ncbi:MAG: ABC transporter permease [Paracoccaceae bacterium]
MKQIYFMIRANLLSMGRRVAISTSMAFSVALAVCVLVGFLSMAAGFEAVLNNSGSERVGVVLGGGTTQETGSDISPDTVRSLQAMQLDIGVRRDENRNLILSQELVQVVVLPTQAGKTQSTVSLRGMNAVGAQLRDGVQIVQGRMFQEGSRELAVGQKLAAENPNLAVGNTVRLGAVDWLVVGHYAAGGSIFESEMWAGIDVIRAAFDRQGQVQTLRLQLDEPDGLAKLNAVLSNGISNAPLNAVSEAELFAGQSSRTVDQIRLFGWPIAILMAFGAVAGAVNTMMSSVSDRTVEIATVRALGFSRLSAFAATWVEALVLAMIGTAVGILASWFIFNGWQASTLGANNTRMAFQLVVNGDVMKTVAMFGISIGLLGGLLPAISAMRIPLIAALRAGS